MKYKIEILPSAWNDFKKLEGYFVLQFGEKRALEILNHILDVIERLGDHPHSGSDTPDAWLNERGYRMIIIHEKCIAIYRMVDDVVYIYHIADTRSEYTKLFY
ncbi:type II toxin-antitoxin system RelE/ParE family toxin [Catenibacterium sp. RTP21428st1_D7_RTP21428_210409]|uniref:type II toxin-antitoxin system RelE/ParE family toxin n=1 Tax=unclassified Catenibacterium TaxID=2643636 RepID=UPI0032ED6648